MRIYKTFSQAAQPALIALMPMLLLSISLHAQTVRGIISGRVVDPAGAAVTGATVQLEDEKTDREVKVLTGRGGIFAIPQVAAGEYTLKVEMNGFATVSHHIEVPLNAELNVNFTLAVAGGNVVDVTSPAELLKTDSATVSGSISTEQLEALPLDGRNFYELALLLPGVAPSAQGSPGTDRGDFAINVNGAREDSNLFLLDGIYNSDPKLNGLGLQPPITAVREFEVLTNGYDASFGRNAGGQVNVITRSGTNQIHGSAYEFFRNAALDARNYFATEAEKYQRSQFGFNIGGPVVKNRTFFYADYEGLRLHEGITSVTNVPTALERMGDFSKSSVYAVNLQTGQLFPGNVIPAAYINPVGRAIANLYPLPNNATAGQNFVESPTQKDRVDQFDLRLDHAMGSRTELTGRISYENRDLQQPFSGASAVAVPGYGSDVPRHATNALIAVTHSFTPTVVNELRLGFNRVAQQVRVENPLNGNKAVGLPTPWTNARDNGLTNIQVNGYSQLGDEINNPQQGNINTYQITDHLSIARSRHIYKMGFDIRKLEQNAFRDVNSRGFVNFSGFTGNALEELLLGIESYSGYAQINNPQYLRSQSYNFFVNDTFRITPALTLNYGVRYEYNAPGVDKYDHANVYDVLKGSIVPVGTGGVPRGAYNPDKNNFAPRLGVAWKRGNTVLRTGYGLFYDQGALAPSEGLYFSAPYYVSNIYVPFAQFPIYVNDPFPKNYPFPLPSSATAFQRDLKTGYLQDWNLTVQHAFSAKAVAEIGYVGSKGTKLLAGRDANQPTPSTAQQNLRPNPYFADVTYLQSRANSNYNSLQARFQQRMTHGLSGMASYTFSKSIDDASGLFASSGDPNFPQDSNHVNLERGLSNFDVRHRAVLSYNYELPFGEHKWWGGWETSGIWQFQSGRPLTVALQPGFDNSNTGLPVLGFGSVDRPNELTNPNNGPKTVAQWFNTSAFKISPYGTFGSAGRNIVEGPGLASINLALIKNTRLSEVLRLQFRAEFFNAFDRANFGLPNNFIGSPVFGRITSAGDPRRVQLALKLIF